ncbi:hypothetical protein [Zobellia roscoffensis]|uniref:hypothetical protein n=1 Tax=Zobellia roscoffensis TaxID=2779508 RepID=UPI00188B4440|nr:hypothetical protein [Zobellia roscoffensis]
MIKKRFKKDFLPFLPLLFLYSIVVILFSSNELMGDESRYYHYAINISNGFFEEPENPSFGNGPAYPALITPFITLDTPLVFPKLVNAILLFFAIVYFKKTIELFSKNKHNIYLVYLVGLYPPIIRWLPYLYSEQLAFFAICGFLFYTVKLFQTKKITIKKTLLPALFLALLILVKIIFLHVVLMSLLLTVTFLMLKKNYRLNLKKSFIILICAFTLVSPYLLYAYSITGKLFYLGTAGGEILYHRASPYEGELGNWFSFDDVLYGNDENYKPDDVYDNLKKLSRNHRDSFIGLQSLTQIQKDSALKAMALQSMKDHPLKYLKNTIANAGRLVLHYPFSYRNQGLTTYGYMIPNMIIVIFWLLCLYPFILKRKYVPFSIKALMLFCIVYACGIIVLDGRGRNFIVMVPTMTLFIFYHLEKLVKISVVNPKEEIV